MPPAYDEVNSLSKEYEILRTNVNALQEQINSLLEKNLVLEEEIVNKEKLFEKTKQEEEYRKDRLYKRLYVEFDDDVLSVVFNHFNLKKSSTEDNLKLLVNKHSEDEIYNFINLHLEEECRKDKLFKKLYSEFDDEILSKVFKHFNLKKSSTEDNLKLLVDKHSEDEIYEFIELDKKQQDEIKPYVVKFTASEEEYQNFIKNNTEEISEIFHISKYRPKFVEHVMNEYSVRDFVEKVYKSNPTLLTGPQENDQSLKQKLIKNQKKICPICGDDVDCNIGRCPNCNYFFGNNSIKLKERKQSKFIEEEFLGKWCDNCYTYISDNYTYCPHCGSIKIKRIKKPINNNSVRQN